MSEHAIAPDDLAELRRRFWQLHAKTVEHEAEAHDGGWSRYCQRCLDLESARLVANSMIEQAVGAAEAPPEPWVEQAVWAPLTVRRGGRA